VVILCVSACLATPAAASADRIAYRALGPEETPEMWTADAATGGGQTIVPGIAKAEWHALSPTGTQIAFEEKEGTELYVINTDGSGKRRLASSNGGVMAWSPDGKSIVYENHFPQRLYVVNVATDAIRELGGAGRQIYPCWSRDGRYIAFESYPVEGQPSHEGLYYMNADGSGTMKTILVEPYSEGLYDDHANCSFGPRDVLAFLSLPLPYKEGGETIYSPHEIFTAHLDGTDLTQLTSNAETGIDAPDFSKDGTKIFYDESTKEPLCSNLRMMNADGSGKTTLIPASFPKCPLEPSAEAPYLFSVPEPEPEELLGSENPADPKYSRACTGKPVNCATGNETVSQTDLSVGGRGLGLSLTRTYNAQAAVTAKTPEPFGRGWSSSYSDHLVFNSTEGWVKVVQANGSTVVFKGAPGQAGEYEAPEWVQAKLVLSEGTYTYTLPNQETFQFNEQGRLEGEADRNGNATTLSYNQAGQPEAVTDAAGRKLTFAYNTEGFAESVKDPMGHTAKYAYENGNLTSVTLPGEASPRWQFEYDTSHRLIKLTDGRGGATSNEYGLGNRVIAQTDPAERTVTFEYTGSETKVINQATGAVTKERFTKGNELTSITRGYGTINATTESFTYDEAGDVMTAQDGNGHSTEYAYNASGDRTERIDADGHEARWGYNGTHDVISTTTPKGETTTIKRDSHGNPEVIERPAPAGKTQLTKYKYAANGDLESVADPLERTSKYEYDSEGDRTAEIDPEGDKRTWAYDEDSNQTSSVNPRGNVEGAEASKFTTKTERDAQERPVKSTDPLGHATKYAYDANGNLESVTDANGHKTTYIYDADNAPTKRELPNGTIIETGYDGAGQTTSQTDGNKHTTKYARNVLEQVTEVTDALGRKTTKEYDKAGNPTKFTDPLKRSTTNVYDAANHLKETAYSDGKTHLIQYEYDADGARTKMIDGTGTTTLTYDQLDRLIESKDGHGEVAKYEYDLANERTKITYPNGKVVTRTFDKAGRLQKVTDWLEHTTTFAYDPDARQTSTTFPAGSGNEDKYAYDEADQLSEVRMTKGAETLASLAYTRDSDGQLKGVTSKGLPGEEKPAYEYDANSRLSKGATIAYEYDAADNPTKTGASTNTYDIANELKTGTGNTYSYDELGERTKKTPSAAAATTYGYNEAGNLISVERPKEGKTAGLADTYTYDGIGLRASQTISGTTTYLTWDAAEGLSSILNDGANSYIYGAGGVPIEQVSSAGSVLYLHHDQQGSTRLLTSSTGAKEAGFTYDAYGNTTGTTGTAKTPLGYDGQYTSSDTGLIYLRARVYDPVTAQFLSVDPVVSLTGAPYNYAEDNPLNRGDATGLSSWNPLSESFWTEGNVISEGPLNPIPYYEKEIESYENGCGYFASVTHGLEGAVAGAALVPEDWGSQLFLKFADRFPKLGLWFYKQQAGQSVTQPGKLFVAKAVLEKLSRLFGGG
jgi:RHS repeat-associated protein